MSGEVRLIERNTALYVTPLSDHYSNDKSSMIYIDSPSYAILKGNPYLFVRS